MKNSDDQINFNFSRSIDFQKNLELNDFEDILKDLISLSNKSLLFKKHLKLLILELYYCWFESEEQFLSVSMSKRGYYSKSRYNPNSISSFTIKIINFLKSEKLIDFFPGFFDAKNNVRRLSRIRASNILKNEFEKINFKGDWNINHQKREYVIGMDLTNKRIEYADNFRSHEIREIVRNYNHQISKTFFDIPDCKGSFIDRSDNKKIVISESTSLSNFHFYENFETTEDISGGWWDRFDIQSLGIYKKKLIINNNLTGFIDLLDYFFFYLSKKLELKIEHSDVNDLDYFNIDQKCYLIIKGINSKSFKSIFRSLSLEKKQYFQEKEISSENLKAILETFIKKNSKLTLNFYKQKNIKWSGFVSAVFFELLKKIGDINVSLFLVRDKIYFPFDFGDIIAVKIQNILETKLRINKLDVKIHSCNPYDFKPKGFFGKIISSKSNFSLRYLKRKSRYRI